MAYVMAAKVEVPRALAEDLTKLESVPLSLRQDWEQLLRSNPNQKTFKVLEEQFEPYKKHLIELLDPEQDSEVLERCTFKAVQQSGKILVRRRELSAIRRLIAEGVSLSPVSGRTRSHTESASHNLTESGATSKTLTPADSKLLT